MISDRGFTLVELMITLAIAAILLTVAVPSFQSVFQTNRLATQANELVSAINLARSEAIKRGSAVTVCSSSNSTACSGGSWAEGWIVIAADTAEVIRVFPAPTDMTLVDSNATFSFDGRGVKSSPDTDVTFALYPQGCATGTVDRARNITISTVGRANVATGNCP